MCNPKSFPICPQCLGDSVQYDIHALTSYGEIINLRATGICVSCKTVFPLDLEFLRTVTVDTVERPRFTNAAVQSS